MKGNPAGQRLAPPDARHLLEAREGRAGLLILVLSLMLVAGGAWSVWAQIEEVVVAQGRVEPAGRVKIVNHPYGGRVTQLLVQEGDTVEAGEVLMKLDPSLGEAERAEALARYEVQAAEAARLQAEAGGGAIEIPMDLAATRPGLVARERRLLTARRASLAEREATLARSVETHEGNVAKAAAEIGRLKDGVTLLTRQYEAVKALADRGLYPKLKLVEIESERVDAMGESRKAAAEFTAAKAALAEAKSRLSGFAKDAKSEVLDELGTALAERDRLYETLKGEETRIADLVIVAPADGVVQDLSVTAVGQSIGANERLMKIVPLTNGLVVKARVPNDDIGRVKEGMKAAVKVRAYNFARYGSLNGTVEGVTPDASRRDEETQPTYGITVLTDESALGAKGDLRVVPGMLVDVELKVGNRSILSFLTEGIVGWRDRALKEL